MLNNKSISIAVSDDESDELGRMRVQVRRKRKKLHHRFKNGVVRNLVRYWPLFWALVIFLAAIGLLLYEAWTIGWKSPQLNSSGLTAVNNDLNRLDPVTQVVRGVTQRCLPILPPEQLEHLEIPVLQDSTSPVKKLIYTTENDAPLLGRRYNTLSQEHTDATRFNLFTGNQTLDQRGEMFKVNETVTINCGFYSEGGGFKISNEDKNYMKSCDIVVSTCAFGGGDDLYQPIGMSEASLQKVCFVAFWDEVTVSTQESAEHRIGEDGFIGKWRIVVVRDLPFADQRLNGKIPKMLAHRLFPHSKYSIWVDSKSQFRRDPLGVLEALLWRTNSVLAISEHGARSSIYDEAKAVVKKNKAKPEEVKMQLTQYRSDGLPEDKRFNGKKAFHFQFIYAQSVKWAIALARSLLPLTTNSYLNALLTCPALAEASVIVREHTPLTNMFMCLWFNEVVRFTSRDQLSFPYVLWRLKVLKNINMFPVCTRKDLVNSMGHIRKAMPLSI